MSALEWGGGGAGGVYPPASVCCKPAASYKNQTQPPVQLRKNSLSFPAGGVQSLRRLGLSSQHAKKALFPQDTSWFRSATEQLCLKPHLPASLHCNQAFNHDADQQRLSHQQALSHQCHAPLHSSRQQHGRDHHGAQPAAGHAPGGAAAAATAAATAASGSRPGGGQQQRAAVPQQAAEGHVRALPAPQVHQERHGVGPAEAGDEQRGQLPGDGREAGRAAADYRRNAAAR